MCPLKCIVFSIGLFYIGNWVAFGGEGGGEARTPPPERSKISFGGVLLELLFVRPCIIF